MISKLFLILICGLPWGHILFKQADLWHGQGHFFQVGLLLIFCWSFFEKPKLNAVSNIPLGAFTLWAGLITSYLWISTITKTQNYPVKIFMPFFNWLCFIWFYKLSIEYLNEESINKILKWFKYSILLVLFYCVLQVLQLDEFLKGFSHHDELVGTIGNTGHLAGYLAVVSPLFFERKLSSILTLVLLWLIILVAGAASGLFTGLIVILFWLFLKKRFVILGCLVVLFSALGGFVLYKFPVFFTSSGREQIYQLAFDKFRDKAITGYGLGSFGTMKFQPNSNLSIWRHLHNEPYQVAFELGLIGLGLLIWCVWDYFKTYREIRKSDLIVKLAVMFFGFCALSLFTFNAHLWLISCAGMISYSFMYVIKNNSGTQCLGV